MKKINVGIWELGRAGFGMHVHENARFPEMFNIVAGCDIAKEFSQAFHLFDLS